MPTTKYQKRIEKYRGSIIELSSKNYKGSEQLGEAFAQLTEAIENVKSELLDDSEKTEKIANGLNSFYLNCINAIEEFENNNNEVFDKGSRRQIEKIKRAMGKDIKILSDYRREQKKASKGFVSKNFETLLEEGRSKTFTVNSDDISVAGAGQNVRYVMQDGENDTVYFTKSAKGKTYEAQKNSLLREMRSKYKGKSAFLETPLFSKALDDLMANRKKMIDLNSPLYSQEEKMDSVIYAWENSRAGETALNYITTPEQKEIFFDMVTNLLKVRLSVSFNRENGIRQDSIQDKRNSAMSSVAELLGIGDVIAHSENAHITLVDKNGNKAPKMIKGTAMKAAKGIDKKNTGIGFNLSVGSGDFRNYSFHSIENNKDFIRDVANLQVLDYICGNPDRHAANLTYWLDENGKVIGIQGIDNDTSFGEKFVAGKNRSVDPLNMRVIPKSTADMIMSLDKDSLRLMLYGYDLTKPEIDACMDRLDTMKTVIETSVNHYNKKGCVEGVLESGVPRVVDDDKLGEYSVEKQLAVSKNNKSANTFHLLCAGAMGRNTVAALMENNLRESANKINDFTRKGLVDLQINARKIKDVDKWYQSGSNKYTAMRKDTLKVIDMIANFEEAFVVQDKEYPRNTPSMSRVFVLSEKVEALKMQVRKALDSTYDFLREKENILNHLKPGKKEKKGLDPEQDKSMPEKLSEKDMKMLEKLKDHDSRTYKRYLVALENRKILEDQYQKLVEAQRCLEERARLGKDENLLDKLNEKDTEARYKATRKFEENTKREKYRQISEHFERNKAVMEDKTGKATDIDKVRACLDNHIITGMTYLVNKSVKKIREDKDKDPEAYANVKRGIAASLVREKLFYMDEKKEAGKKPCQFDRQLKDMKDIKAENIKNADGVEKCIDELLKSKSFNRAFEKFEGRTQNVTLDKLHMFAEGDNISKAVAFTGFGNEYRKTAAAPEMLKKGQ
ncbi:MAG: hypothetical protein J6M92_09075 [Oribacterium sp.]|nr:hypothetical protein [Oribacterium sp.]